jgi:hypothetical protein
MNLTPQFQIDLTLEQLRELFSVLDSADERECFPRLVPIYEKLSQIVDHQTSIEID